MQIHADKNQENKDISVANAVSQKKSGYKSTFQFVDNRSEAIQMRKIQEMTNNHSKKNSFQFLDNRPEVAQMKRLQEMANNSLKSQKIAQFQKQIDGQITKHGSKQTIQRAAVVERKLPLIGSFFNVPHWEVVAYNKDNNTWWQSGIKLNPEKSGLSAGKALIKNEPVEIVITKKTPLAKESTDAANQRIEVGEIPSANGFKIIHSSKKAFIFDDGYVNQDTKLARLMPEKGAEDDFHPLKKNCQTFVQSLWNEAGMQPPVPELSQNKIITFEQISADLDKLAMHEGESPSKNMQELEKKHLGKKFLSNK